MSRSEGTGNVHVPISPSVLAANGLILPLQEPTYLPPYRTHFWSRVNHFDRYPRPFHCDRLQRLPPHRSFITTADSTDELNTSLSSRLSISDRREEMDVKQKVHQLEKNLAFVKEQHALVLRSLHEEVEELKEKNRELQFHLTMGTDASDKESSNIKQKSCCSENKVKIDKLEKELKKLRAALRDALKSNAALVTQLELFKREQYLNASSVTTVPYQPIQFETCPERMTRAPQPSGSSHKIDEYRDTIYQIDQASARARIGRGYHSGYYRDGSGYNDSRGRQNQQNHRLPRFPLRNTNMSHIQYEIQYRQRSSINLPNLKQQVIPVMDRGEKYRKNRGNPRPQVPHH